MSQPATQASPQATSHRAFWEHWFSELWGKRNASVIDEFVAETCFVQGLPTGGNGRASVHRFYRAFGAAFPDIHIKVEDCIECGEQSAVRCAGYVRDYNGQKHELRGVVISRFHNGKIVETFSNWDFLSVLGSAGVIEPNTLSTYFAEQGKIARRD